MYSVRVIYPETSKSPETAAGRRHLGCNVTLLYFPLLLIYIESGRAEELGQHRQ